MTIRQLRLASGLILFTYVSLHLLTLSLGLGGIALLNAVGDLSGVIVGTVPGLVILYGALLVHVGLALFSLYRRRRLKMPAGEAAQLILGFSIPFLLALHVSSVRLGEAFFDVDYDYRLIQTYFWTSSTQTALQQLAGLIAAWLHGCIGVYFWLRLQPAFQRWQSLLATLAAVLPTAALAGFVASGREVRYLFASDPTWFQTAMQPLAHLSPEEFARLAALPNWIGAAMAGLILGTLALRAVRLRLQARQGRFTVSYADGRRVSGAVGASILDISRDNGVPHASVCGGRGRCSTCRIQLVDPNGSVDPPSDQEAMVLRRINAAEGVRLACQTRPRQDVSVTLLLPPDAGPRAARSRAGYREGNERVMCILFADLRGFTKLSEQKLPYDVVFLLNRFAREMGEAVALFGGRVDKFMGDGVMALFGLDTDPERAAQDALRAAQEMQQRLHQINADLAADLPAPLRMGIGIHAGRVIVGEIGHGATTGLTAVGDAVNTASRLEAMTKTLDAGLVVSRDLADLAGVELPDARVHEIEIRGRAEKVCIFALGRLDAPAFELRQGV